MFGDIFKSSREKTGANKYGDFKYQSECKCGDQHLMIREVYLKSCRLTNPVTHTVFNILSGLAMKTVVHDYVLGCYKCKECGKKGVVTVDYGAGGCEISFGKFHKVSLLSKDKRLFLNHCPISLKKIKGFVVLLKEDGFTKPNYHPIDKNCQHFAKDLFEMIFSFFENSKY